jgi:hypothetical protein
VQGLVSRALQGAANDTPNQSRARSPPRRENHTGRSREARQRVRRYGRVAARFISAQFIARTLHCCSVTTSSLCPTARLSSTARVAKMSRTPPSPPIARKPSPSCRWPPQSSSSRARFEFKPPGGSYAGETGMQCCGACMAGKNGKMASRVWELRARDRVHRLSALSATWSALARPKIPAALTPAGCRVRTPRSLLSACPGPCGACAHTERGALPRSRSRHTPFAFANSTHASLHTRSWEQLGNDIV